MAQVAQEIVDLLAEVPPFPKAVTKLIHLLGDEGACASELASIISSDPGLTIKVLHIANSPFYMCSRRINSVDEAVIVLGVGTLKSVATGAALQSGLHKIQPAKHVCDMSAYWKHSFAAAISARSLALGLPDIDNDMAYLAGLVHDVGKIVQARYWPESWKSALNHLAQTNESFEIVETKYFGTSSNLITRQLCDRWGFPTSLLTLLPADRTVRSDDSSLNAGSLLAIAEDYACAAGFYFPWKAPLRFSLDENDEQRHLIGSLSSEVSHQLQILD